MRRIDLTIAFKDDDDASREERQTVETSYTPELGGEHRVAHILLAELKVMVGEQGPPRHNATVRGWLNFPNQPAGIEQYFDIQNSQAMWLELANLVMGAEGDLILAQAFKSLEPPQEPPFGDDVAINDLYYLHDRKITLLNQTVHAVVKVQDLVNLCFAKNASADMSLRGNAFITVMQTAELRDLNDPADTRDLPRNWTLLVEAQMDPRPMVVSEIPSPDLR